MALLGDLGHLAYTEQLHWRSFNVATGKMSHTAFERSFLGEFADPEKPDLYFKMRFASFQNNWEAVFGWKLSSPCVTVTSIASRPCVSRSRMSKGNSTNRS
jgi:hypothetical protein